MVVRRAVQHNTVRLGGKVKVLFRNGAQQVLGRIMIELFLVDRYLFFQLDRKSVV